MHLLNLAGLTLFLVFTTNVVMCLKLCKVTLDPFKCDCKVMIEQVIHIDKWMKIFSENDVFCT